MSSKTTKRKDKDKKVLRKCIGKEELQFILKKIDELEKDNVNKFNLKLLNVILYYTGLRLNEALLLNKKNLMEWFDKGKLRVYCKKTKDYRWIYLQETMKNQFLSHFDDDKNRLFEKIDEKGIVNHLKNKLIERTASRWMDKYFDLLEQEFGGSVVGLKGRAWGTHSYRINFINNIIRNADLDQASKMIGHKNVTTTLIYFRQKPMNDSEVEHILNASNF